MALVNTVEKRVKLSRPAVIKFQVLTYCFLQGIEVGNNELDLIAFLGEKGRQEFQSFCEQVAGTGLYESAQSARNSLNRTAKKGLVIKEGKHNIKVFVNPEIQLQTQGNILLDFKMAHLE